MLTTADIVLLSVVIFAEKMKTVLLRKLMLHLLVTTRLLTDSHKSAQCWSNIGPWSVQDWQEVLISIIRLSKTLCCTCAALAVCMVWRKQVKWTRTGVSLRNSPTPLVCALLRFVIVVPFFPTSPVCALLRSVTVMYASSSSPGRCKRCGWLEVSAWQKPGIVP